MVLSIIYLVVGLVLILTGANALTEGASAIAKRWGVSDLVIGLTVVAFGTSAPELVISIISAINGNAGLAVGNVVGSNIFNVLAIIGITAIVMPIKVDRSVISKDIPLVVLSALVLLAMGNTQLLDGTQTAILTRSNGIILLLFFAIFMRYTFAQASNPSVSTGETSQAIAVMPMWKSVIWVVGGLAALLWGGDRFVAGASDIASAMGISDTVIGLTIVAAGTSLPELATSITAALKGKTGIALGNVIGSNIFNIFLVLGSASTIQPLPFGDINNLDLMVLTIACILFWVFAQFFKQRTITRVEGTILASGYVAYIVYLVIQANQL